MTDPTITKATGDLARKITCAVLKQYHNKEYLFAFLVDVNRDGCKGYPFGCGKKANPCPKAYIRYDGIAKGYHIHCEAMNKAFRARLNRVAEIIERHLMEQFPCVIKWHRYDGKRETLPEEDRL